MQTLNKHSNVRSERGLTPPAPSLTTALLTAPSLVGSLLLLTGMFAGGLEFAAGNAEAQVVLSVGAQEVYDDNVYLEDDKGVPPPFVVDQSLSDPTMHLIPPIQADGHKNDDLITNLFVSASGALPLGSALKGSAEGKVGALLFGDNTDESRMTLDGTLNITTEKTLIPAPFSLFTNHAIHSQAADITVAQGTAARQSQTYDGTLGVSASPIQLLEKTDLGVAYTFGYHAFLGDFTFNDNATEDLGPFSARFKSKGSDYLTNSLDSNLDQKLTDNWVAGLYGGVTDYVFTRVETNDIGLQDRKADDLDRTEGRVGVRSTYRVAKDLTLTGTSGVSLSHFKNAPQERTITVISDDGTETTSTFNPDQDETSFTFGGDVSYSLDPESVLKLAVDQGQRVDVDGNRLITRSVSLDAVKGFGDRWHVHAGGRFLQYNIGSTISNPTDRYEAGASVQYNLTQAIALEAGYNYTRQSTDKSNLTQRFFFDTEDYTSNRVFVGVTTGLVGTKG